MLSKTRNVHCTTYEVYTATVNNNNNPTPSTQVNLLTRYGTAQLPELSSKEVGVLANFCLSAFARIVLGS